MSKELDNLSPAFVKKTIWGTLALVVLIVALAFVKPWYNVWSQEMEDWARL